MRILDLYLFHICVNYWLNELLHNIKICKSHFFLGHPVYMSTDLFTACAQSCSTKKRLKYWNITLVMACSPLWAGCSSWTYIVQCTLHAFEKKNMYKLKYIFIFFNAACENSVMCCHTKASHSIHTNAQLLLVLGKCLLVEQLLHVCCAT